MKVQDFWLRKKTVRQKIDEPYYFLRFFFEKTLFYLISLENKCKSMKTKKSLIFIILLLLSIVFAESDEKRFSLFVEPTAGFKEGTYGEYIYTSVSISEPLSYLEWNLNPLWTLGLNFHGKYKNFGFNLNTSFGLPSQCGTMYDSDWDIFKDLKVMYSINEVYSSLNFDGFLDVFYDFDFSSFFSISPFCSLYYSYSSLSAKNGYGWYGTDIYSLNHNEVSWDDPNARFFSKGKLFGIDFLRHSFFTFFGLMLRIEYDRLCLSSGFMISPFSYFYTDDHHLNRKNGYHFIEIQKAFWADYRLDFEILVRLTKKINLLNHIQFLFGKNVFGDFSVINVYSNDGELYITDQKSSSFLNLLSFNIGLSFSI